MIRLSYSASCHPRLSKDLENREGAEHKAGCGAIVMAKDVDMAPRDDLAKKGWIAVEVPHPSLSPSPNPNRQMPTVSLLTVTRACDKTIRENE